MQLGNTYWLRQFIRYQCKFCLGHNKYKKIQKEDLWKSKILVNVRLLATKVNVCIRLFNVIQAIC